MAQTTNRGRELARKLGPAIGTTWQINETCSLIARHARTHHRLMEIQCNDADLYEWAEKREEQIERRISELVADLPHTDEGPIRVKFSGDPRGATVKLVMPGTLVRMHDDWGQEGVCV